MAPSPARPFILVLAGVNGSGKSSLGGAMLKSAGLSCFNPDALSRELVRHGGLTLKEANARAWQHGRELLESAIAQRASFAFETTLGAHTIPALLADATHTHDVMMIFVGLSSPEQHIDRVRLRVAHGGHPIPEEKIRERWISSRENLIGLMPHLARLQLLDNSADARPGEEIPAPLLVLEVSRGQLRHPDASDPIALARTPPWARAIVQAAIELY